MIQVHSCNLLYLSIVMTDGLFEQVSVLVMIPCFLKKTAYIFLSVNCLIDLLSLHFCIFQNWLSFNTIYRSIGCKNDPIISSFLGCMYNFSTSCLYFSINKIFTHVLGIFTVTLQVISIVPWTIGDQR